MARGANVINRRQRALGMQIAHMGPLIP
jgi:hypothetical protein